MASCLNITLPYEVAPNHGKDLRDWMLDGHTDFADLLALASDPTTAQQITGSEELAAMIASGEVDEVADDDKPQSITNAEIEYSEDDEGAETKRTVPIELSEIITRIFSFTEGWPKRVGNSLFSHERDSVRWLDSTPTLFGWLGRKHGIIEWHRKIGCVTKEELFAELRGTAEQLIAVESLPHEPPMAGHYYAHEPLPEGTGEYITSLVNRFTPATEADRWLILAMFATMFWGGNGGSRPIFTITSDAGRGIGKTTLPDMAAYLAQGCIELSQNEDSTIMRQRLLSPEGIKKRVARIDNVKSHRFSWAEFESLVTAPIISGKQMYVGEGSRPNNITWMITINGVSFSTDIAQRSIIIKLGRPSRNPKWKSETIEYIDKYRKEIIADLILCLQQPANEISCVTRWAEWEEGVLGRLIVPDLDEQENEFGIASVQAVIASRGKDADAESEEVEIIEEYFADQLADLNYDVESAKIHIPLRLAAEWTNAALLKKGEATAISKNLQQLATEGATKKISMNSSRSHGRGFIWNPESEYAIDYDIKDRIDLRKKESQEKRMPLWKKY